MLPSHRLSVLLCTHNPRREAFARTLSGLAAQSLAPEAWELIVVDNASEPALKHSDLRPIAGMKRIVREEKLGLTLARLAAIRAACESPAVETLVFVDDDNVLDADYLAAVLAIFEKHEKIGAVGGPIAGEFEIDPPRWARRYLPFLAVGDFGREIRMEFEKKKYESWYPRGAGMGVRRAVAEAYARDVSNNPVRLGLDRIGGQLGGSGDIDLVFTAFDAGLGVGYFPQLRLTHLIPRERLEYDYLKNIIFQSMASSAQLAQLRGLKTKRRPWPLDDLGALALCLKNGGRSAKELALSLQIPCGTRAGRRLPRALPGNPSIKI